MHKRLAHRHLEVRGVQLPVEQTESCREVLLPAVPCTRLACGMSSPSSPMQVATRQLKAPDLRRGSEKRSRCQQALV